MDSGKTARVVIQQTAEQGVAAVGAKNAPRLNANR
jgi:hypothetical protein